MRPSCGVCVLKSLYVCSSSCSKISKYYRAPLLIIIETLKCSTGRNLVLVSKAPPPLPSPPLIFCMPYGAAPSGCFSLNSPPPPTPNLCFWLLSARYFDSYRRLHLQSVCAAPPTNLPLSLLRESFVIAIGFNTTAAHLCAREAFSDASSGAFLPWLVEEEGDTLSPPPSVFHYTYLFSV